MSSIDRLSPGLTSTTPSERLRWLLAGQVERMARTFFVLEADKVRTRPLLAASWQSDALSHTPHSGTHPASSALTVADQPPRILRQRRAATGRWPR